MESEPVSQGGPGGDPDAFAAEAAKMTDEELLDSWQSASDEETENLSPFLLAVVEEMEQRGIPLT